MDSKQTFSLAHSNRSEVHFTPKGDVVAITSSYYCPRRGPRIASQLVQPIADARETYARLLSEGFYAR